MPNKFKKEEKVGYGPDVMKLLEGLQAEPKIAQPEPDEGVTTHPGYPGLVRLGPATFRHTFIHDGDKFVLQYQARSWAVAQSYYVDAERHPNRMARRYGIGVTMTRAVREYLALIKATCSHQRFMDMRGTLTRFLAFTGKGRRPRALSLDDAQAFLTHEAARGVSANTMRQYTKRIRAFGKWLRDNNWIDGDFTHGTKLPKAEPTKIDSCRYVSWVDLEPVLKNVADRGHLALADAIFSMWALGLRWGEVWSITSSRVSESSEHQKHPTLLVKSLKGAPDRRVPIMTLAVVDAVLRLADWRKGYNRGTAQAALDTAFRQTEIPRFTFHALRHSAITRWLNVDRCILTDVQRWAGHASPDETARYICEDVRSLRLPDSATAGARNA